MIRLREPYIKPPQIVDRLPKPSSGFVVPETIANISGVTIYPMPDQSIIPNLIITSSWIVNPINRFICASGYWHCAANWSLGHVPTMYENVLISGLGTVYCMVHGDIVVQDIIVASRVYLDIGSHSLIQVRSLTLEPNARLDMNSSTWTVSGDWNAPEAQVNAGTSTVYFSSSGLTYTNNNIITSTGVAFYGGVSGTNTS